MVEINSEEMDVAGKTVAQYLATTNYDPRVSLVYPNQP